MPASRPELAGYYGGMAGLDLLGAGRLNLIGWQVKQADVSRVGTTTRINLWLGTEGYVPPPDKPPSDGEKRKRRR